MDDHSFTYTDRIAALPEAPLQDGVIQAADVAPKVVTGIARKMVQVHVDAALTARRQALHRLRMGDRADHLSIMKLTRLPLLQARAWKDKPKCR